MTIDSDKTGAVPAQGPAADPILRPYSRRVLLVLPFSPNPIRGRTLDILAQLVRHAAVDVLCLDDGTPIQLPKEVRHSIVIPSASRMARALRILLGLIRGIPIYHEFYNSLRLRGTLARMDLEEYDAVFVHRLPVHRLLKHRNLVYDCNDCYSYQSRLFADVSNSYKRFLFAIDSFLAPRHEVAACNSAALVLVTAEREAERLRKLGVSRPIEVWIHDRRAEQRPRLLRNRERFVVSFHGKLSYEANLLALRALNDVIAPALDPSRYDLRIIGKCPPAIRKSFPKLQFTGYVERIAEAVADSDLCVFPLVLSVGFPNKAMESLSVGVPFIAAPGVIEGLPPMPGLIERGVYVREIGEFPAEIERFRGRTLPERQQISQRCYEYVQRVYDTPLRDQQWERILRRPVFTDRQAQTEVVS
jgi:glycosyltransferase involved in cell wall biosynthesis